MSEHTKTLWKIDKELGSRSGEWLISMDAGDKGRGIAVARTVEGSGQELNNARHIVRCVNNHERLASELSFAATLLDSARQKKAANSIRALLREIEVAR